MSLFKGSYLRVLSPRTTDGQTPQMQDDRLVYKEDHLPLTAKPHLEKQNAVLPAILRKKIEVVNPEDAAPVKNSKK